jgi:hypothetical protein
MDEMWSFDREKRADSVHRANEVLAFLHNRPEKSIAVVSHSGFMSMSLFTNANHKVAMGVGLETPFENCEMRAVEIFFYGNKYHLQLLGNVQRSKLHMNEQDSKNKALAHRNMAQLYQFKEGDIERKLVSIRRLNPDKVGNPKSYL